MVEHYYNEFNKKNVAALKQLIKDGILPPGDVDDRPVQEVRANEVMSYTQCHFFAGIGGWQFALQLAAYPTDRPVWTGSCPCQPFSSAGKQKGKSDERHLWPVWLDLIKQCRPPIIFGEQVASAITHGWLDDVYQGLEAEGYSCGSAVLPACCVGAPHKRERLFFVGDSRSAGWERHGQPKEQPDSQGWDNTKRHSSSPSFWSGGEWVRCADGKCRLVEPSIQLLAHGIPARCDLLHAAGNSIVLQVAAEFIAAFMNVDTINAA